MKKTIESYDLKNKTVIIRADLNVPIKEGKVKDNSRILASVKTIKYALDNGAKVVVLSHLGRVKTEIDKIKTGLRPVYEELNKELDGRLRFTAFTRGPKVEVMVKEMKYGEALLLENTRFEDIEGEKESKNDPELAESWAKLGELFINDAFGTLHREHASNVGLAKLLPSGLGFLVVKELNELDKLDNPERPFAIIMGGAKVSDKLGVIKTLITKADKMLIGGGMAFTFLKAKGVEIGKSLVEDEQLEYCKELLDNYGDKIVLPIDFKVAQDTEDVMPMISDTIGMYQMGLDIGPKTIKLFQDSLEGVKTCFWNGPLGMYENPNYQEGTKMVLDYIAKSDMYSILGGGDIVTCANQFGYSDKISFLSTGGGASLEYLENKDLPGLRYISEE